MDCVDFPRVLPNSPRKARGQIQVGLWLIKVIVSLITRCPLTKLELARVSRTQCWLALCASCACFWLSLNFYFASSSVWLTAPSRLFAGHLWTDVFRQKVSFFFSFTNTKAAGLFAGAVSSCYLFPLFEVVLKQTLVPQFPPRLEHPAKFPALLAELPPVPSLCCGV